LRKSKKRYPNESILGQNPSHGGRLLDFYELNRRGGSGLRRLGQLYWGSRFRPHLGHSPLEGISLDRVLLNAAPPTRHEDHQVKQARIREFLEDAGYDAVLLTTRAGFAWFTSGGENGLGGGESTCAAIFATREKAVAVIHEPHVRRIAEEQLSGLGLAIEPVPWPQALHDVCHQLAKGLKTASDGHWPGMEHQGPKLARLRVDLTRLERVRYREVGRAVSHAVEATCRSVVAGVGEAEVAGELSHRLLKHELEPLELYVAADQRVEKYGRPVFTNAPIRKRVWICAVARRYGLCAGTARTVCLGEIDRTFIKDFKLVSMVAGACIYYSRSGRTSAEIMRKITRCYEQMARVEEFLRSDPGFVTGYQACEVPLTPDSRFELGEPQALLWRPVVGCAASCDTVVVDSLGFETVTGLQKWPQLQVEVGGHQIERPDLLIRD